MTITPRRFLHTIGHAGAAASLMGGAFEPTAQVVASRTDQRIGLDNPAELAANSYTYLLPDRLDKYSEAWAEVNAAGI